MRGLIECAVVAVSALSIVCEGYTPVRVRGLQANSTAAPVPPENMAMASPKGKSKGSKGVPSDKSSGGMGKSEKSMMGKDDSSGGMMMMGSMKGKSDKGTSSMSTKGMDMMGKGKGKGKGKGGSDKSTNKGMKMMMMMGKGKGVGTRAPNAPIVPTAAPVLGPGETYSPTISPSAPVPFPELSVEFTLFYTIDQFRLPLPSEFAAVTALTDDHVSPFYESGFDDDDLVTYFSSATVLKDTDFNFGEPVGITYTSTLVFTQDSFVPREAEVEALITRAFSGNNLSTYVGQLTSLPPANLFSTTTEVTLSLEEATARSGGILGANSTNTQRIAVGAGAGAAVAALTIAALVFSGRRRDEAKARQKTLGSDGHCTVGDMTYDSRSLNERAEESNGLEDVNLEEED